MPRKQPPASPRGSLQQHAQTGGVNVGGNAQDVYAGGFHVHLSSPEQLDRTLRDPAAIEHLFDEAVFAMHATEWPGNATDAEWVMRQVRTAFMETALIPREEAHLALREAERRLASSKADTQNEGFERVRYVLEPVLRILPYEADYLQAIKHIPHDVRPVVLSRGYDRMVRDRDDFWAWGYLLLLRDLGETPSLKQVLKQRLLDMWKLEGGDPDHPPRIHKKAFVATARLAEDVLADGFWPWYEDEVRGVIAERHRNRTVG